MAKKITYRVRNWKDYNRSLINRGNLTLWFSPDVIKSGYQKPSRYPKQGRSFTYSDTYIELALTLRSLFHFSLRAMQGFLEGLISLLGLKLQVSHYSRLSRRGSTLNIQLVDLKKRGKKPTDLVIDSTGLKIFGEGEWKVPTHGKQKRRTWRKYHVSVNPDSHEVTAVELTTANIIDDHMISTLLCGQRNVGKVYAEGADSYKNSFDAIAEVGGTPLIPVRSGTTLVKKEPSHGQKLRNQLLLDIWHAGGKNNWKKTSDYHRRSLVETHMSRLKTILGGKLRGRKLENQKVEAQLMAKILNKMTSLGMPLSEMNI